MTEPRTFSLRYRPQTFEELFDQNHIKRTLVNAIERNRIVHAYLFAGPRGVGKTTTARILAKSLNCEHGPTTTPCNKCSACIDIKASKSLDVLEIDGASNRGIDHIRELRDNVRYSPTSGKYRIYIIDEVHMLTTESFNALLKTLEEPPSHVIFIFATTEPHKVLPTILSRCQRFDFKRIPPEIIAERLQMIVKEESLEVSEDAIRLISDIADGGLRDAESILEQITTFKEGKVQAKDVTELLGIVPHERFNLFMKLLREEDEAGLLNFLEETFHEGYDVTEFYFGFIGFLRALLFSKLGMQVVKSSFSDSVLNEACNFDAKVLARMLGKFLSAEEGFKRSLQKAVYIETLALSLLPLVHTSTDSEKDTKSNLRKNSDRQVSSSVKSSSASSEKKRKSSTVQNNNPNRVVDSGSEPKSKDNPAKKTDSSSLDKQANSLSSADLWKKFLDELKGEESFVSFTLKDSVVLKDDGPNILIGIQPELAHQLGLLSENVKELETKLSQISGEKKNLEFKVIEKSKKKQNKSKNSGAVDDVLDIFKGEIVR